MANNSCCEISFMCMELNCKYVECVGDGDGAEDDGQCLDLDIHYICSKKKRF